MANIKSQKKRILTNEKRRLRNKAVKSELKTYVRKTREAVAAGDVETAEAALRVATRKLDKAVSKGVIHKNQAANRKSKLAVQVANGNTAPPEPRTARPLRSARLRTPSVGSTPRLPTDPSSERSAA